MPSRRDRIGLRKLVLAIWLGALLQVFAQPVRAEVRVSGQTDALIVKTSSDTTAQAMPPLLNATPGVVMMPVPAAMAAGDVPAFPAVKTLLMFPPAPNPEFSFGPPIISLPAGFPIPRPAPGGTASP